jgi:hypothetical protein
LLYSIIANELLFCSSAPANSSLFRVNIAAITAVQQTFSMPQHPQKMLLHGSYFVNVPII